MKEFVLGFSFLWKGFVYLARHRRLWWLVVVPFLINLVILVGLVVAVIWLSAHWLSLALPEVWWAAVLSVVIASAAAVLIFFLGIILFSTVSSIIGAPFYEALCFRVDDTLGGKEFERTIWQQIKDSFRNSRDRVFWFLLIQVCLLVLLAIPFVVGLVTYTIIGFIATVSFVALEYLDFIFERRGYGFRERLWWCIERKWLTAGFGVAVFVGLAIPVVNLFVPAAAAVGSALFFAHADKISLDSELFFDPLLR